MKRFTLTTIGSLLLGATILISSCSKDGDTGPEGPAGPRGPQGEQGTPGAQGASGVSQVYFSDWKDVKFEGADGDGDGIDDFNDAVITATQITSEIINSGEIKVYLNLGTTASPVVVTLPFQNVIIPVFRVGSIELQAPLEIDASTEILQDGSKIWTYRYVIIPGSTKVNLKAKGVDLSNYQAVKDALKITN